MSENEKIMETTKNTKRILTFMGEPGSGKGTLARLCVEKLDYRVLSTGDLLRRHIAEKTSQGLEVEAILKEGRLVSDQLITSMVGEWLSHATAAGRPIILDGYPRTTVQAEMFLALIKEQFPDYSFSVVFVSLPHEEIVQRLAKRVVCESKTCQATYSLSMFKDQENLTCLACNAKLVRRLDDAEDVVRKRLSVYGQHRDEILNFYKEHHVHLDTLSVSGLSIDEVFELFRTLVG